MYLLKLMYTENVLQELV